MTENVIIVDAQRSMAAMEKQSFALIASKVLLTMFSMIKLKTE